MSKTSMKERNKAIRLAWEREQQLVQEGKATRDWTKEQQADILNPDKGKAYDDLGRSFVGQHMKSAAKYPEYQGDPDNIQFLTYDEHLEAHKGSWQNPTNWYYDPVTKEFHDFGDGEIVLCKIMSLSNPIVVIESSGQKGKVIVDGESINTKGEEQPISPSESKQNSPSHKTTIERTAAKSIASIRPSGPTKVHKPENELIRGLKTVRSFIVKHPVKSVGIAGTVIVGGIELASAISGSRNKRGRSSTPGIGSGTTNPPKTTKVADIVEKAIRAENDVTGHKQRYHTKDGVIWKDKAPYHRGGKNS